jgi:NNP family nitrate/nitrite transporter-like MFS transporter
MLPRSFFRCGHWPTLLAAFLYFDVSFMVWGVLGVLINDIVIELPLGAAQKGLLVATPILGGALLRLPMGILADRFGGRRAGMFGLALTTLPLLLGWLWADSYPQLLMVGLLLGIAGASFAVALPLASRWYPPEHQGLALGIAGAGNSGSVLAALIAPRLAEVLGWRPVLGAAAALIVATLLIFAWLAKDSPHQPPPRRLADYAVPLRTADAWRFCGFYAVTFGGFVGLANFLTLFFYEQYSLSRVSAGTLTAACVFSGSMLRPVGGWLADRFGGVRLLTGLLAGAAGAMAVVATLPPLAAALPLMVLVMGLLGTGNGAIFQLIPQRFQREIGVVTGLVGAAGGVGGFFLPSLLGLTRELTGSFGPGLALLAGVAATASVNVWLVGRNWQATGAIFEPAAS